MGGIYGNNAEDNHREKELGDYLKHEFGTVDEESEPWFIIEEEKDNEQISRRERI